MKRNLLKLPKISVVKAIRVLECLGFEQVRQKGSHVVMKKQTPDGAVGCTVPLSRQLAVSTLDGILRQAQVTPEELSENLSAIALPQEELHVSEA